MITTNSEKKKEELLVLLDLLRTVSGDTAPHVSAVSSLLKTRGSTRDIAVVPHPLVLVETCFIR